MRWLCKEDLARMGNAHWPNKSEIVCNSLADDLFVNYVKFLTKRGIERQFLQKFDS